MSVAKSTLSEDVHHRMLPPLGLYFFNSSCNFPIDTHLLSHHNVECNHTIPVGLPHHSPLLSHHNVECNHTIPVGLPHHSPLLSHHNAEDNHTIPMGLRAAWPFIAKT